MASPKTKLVIPILLLYLSSFSSAERILFMAPACSKSHKFSFMPVAEALAARGHEITVVTPYRPFKAVENIREIVLRDTSDEFDFNFFEMKDKNPLEVASMMSTIFSMFMTKGYSELMKNEEFKEILKDPQFDLVIYDALFNEFVLPIIDTWGVPRVPYCPSSGVTWILVPLGISPEYASVPAGMASFDNEMTFFQRLQNMLSSELFLLIRKYFTMPLVDKMVKEDFPNARPVSEIERGDSLILLSHNMASAWPRTLPPNVIPVGGLHLRPGKPLPKDLQDFADGAVDGLIVFTLGSAIPVSSMPKEMAQTFLKVFSRIPQRVVWKWEKSDFENIPQNVLLIDWLPQQDLLEHPNARIFISHGGLGGTQEAMYSGVPMLGIPFSNDQQTNVVKGVKDGWALSLDWDHVTEESLGEAIDALINKPSFRANAAKMSNLLRDTMMPPKDVAVYWVEHVLRHGGSRHLQLSSKNMPFYQVYLLDVWLFLGAVALIATYIITSSIRILLRKCLSSSPKSPKLKTK